MDYQQYAEQFKDIGEKIKESREKANILEHQAKKAKTEFESFSLMSHIIKELDLACDNDPGKHGPAYFFVSAIGKRDISHSENPSLQEPCPSCNTQYPVIMSYDQTCDSPDGDTWTKEAFLMCPKDGISPIAIFHREHRFL
ncbi:MAG: hypothetical protein AABX73_02025 [Nanoarchaeota archaeon]